MKGSFKSAINDKFEMKQGKFYRVGINGTLIETNDNVKIIKDLDPTTIMANTFKSKQFLAATAHDMQHHHNNPKQPPEEPRGYKFTDILAVVFSTTGLIILLVLIIIFGIILGLIPIYKSIMLAGNAKYKNESHWENGTQNPTKNLLMPFKSASLYNFTSTNTPTTRITCLPMPPPTLNLQVPAFPSISADQVSSFAKRNGSSLALLKASKSASKKLFKCPFNSPYVPAFLTKNELTSFGYPIHQIIVCYSSSSAFFINCPNDQLIHIYSAYYGIQDATSTDTCNSVADSRSSSVLCYNQNTFDLVYSSCEYKQNCTLIVSTNYFGDPCLGYRNKQMFVQYQCINAIDTVTYTKIKECPVNGNMSRICPLINDPTVMEITECTDFITISCQPNQHIQIICSFYGIDPVLRCNGGYYTGAPTACYLKSSSETIYTLCNGKQRCSIDAGSDFSQADPCVSYAKMLYVQYRCVNTRLELRASVATSAVTESSSYEPPTTTTADYYSTLPYCAKHVQLNGSCVSNSIFEPKQLTNITSISFGFPINQQIVCDRSQLFIACPAGQEIHIYSAYYGIQAQTSSTCNNNTLMANTNPSSSSPYLLPDACFLTNSFSLINATCESKQNCSLTASAGFFGNPCSFNFQKQLLIQYQCVDYYILDNTNSITDCTKQNLASVSLSVDASSSTTENNNSSANLDLTCLSNKGSRGIIYQAVWCAGSTNDDLVNLTCADKQVPDGKLQIECAFYGYHPVLTLNSICAPPQVFVKVEQSSSSSTTNSTNNSTTAATTTTAAASSSSALANLQAYSNCYFKSSLLDYFGTKCGDRPACILRDFSDIFYNPCPLNLNATLIVQYSCQ